MSDKSSRSESWLDRVAHLLSRERSSVLPRPFRRLAAEQLERRTVLSVATLADQTTTTDSTVVGGGTPSDVTGTAAPTESTQTPATDSVATTTDSTGLTQDSTAADQYFDQYDSGGGTAAASGSGAGVASGSGSGGGMASGSGSGGGVASGSGSGGGGASGSGSGGGDASGSGSGGVVNEPPTVSASIDVSDPGGIIISGTVSDDGGIGGLVVSIDGVVSGTVTTDANGTFTITMPHPLAGGAITIMVTDANGVSSELQTITLVT